ncbi:Alpha/Beta hydrolase protein [Mycena metata]|uniref:Alpha/Beta hydrolase protein n=1 Tax=Mycena metata TaxID=1033252 RepID=A0AAD7JNH0_9AGAR|nr:Alpha/Beta hydrolase protein [Mycena metata]
MAHSTCELPDGAVLAYDVLGSSFLGEELPLVLVCGMSSARADWMRLSSTWAQTRPVLVYDHRGIGDSTSPPGLEPGADEFTMETLGRDLAFLIGHLGWPDVAILGFSMGGVVLQEMLVLPYHPTNPAPLPFHPTHVILACTRAEVLRDPKYGLQTVPEPLSRPPTNAERYERVRRTIAATVDPVWIENHGKHIDFIVQGVLSGSPRSLHTISRQRKALQLFDFAALLERIPADIRVLVIHGELDQIIPFECSQEILRRIPHARFVEIGPEPGKLPSLQFGHNFTLYFPVQIWENFLKGFLSAEMKPPSSEAETTPPALVTAPPSPLASATSDPPIPSDTTGNSASRHVSGPPSTAAADSMDR